LQQKASFPHTQALHASLVHPGWSWVSQQLPWLHAVQLDGHCCAAVAAQLRSHWPWQQFAFWLQTQA